MNQNLNVLFIFLFMIFYPSGAILAHSRPYTSMDPCEATINKHLRIIEEQKRGTIPIELFNQFRRAYNQGRITENDRFVMWNFRQPAKILSLDENTLTLGVVATDGRLQVIRLLRTENSKAVKSAHRYTSIYTSLDVQSFFDYFDSPVKVVPSLYVDGNQKSEELERQGYKLELYSGIDKVVYLVKVGQLLLRRKFNPFQTHIVYFANQVDAFIEHIRKGILLQKEERHSQWRTRLKILERLKQEALLKINERKVTYFWWLTFTLRLSYLATDPQQRNFIDEHDWFTPQGVKKELKKRPSSYNIIQKLIYKIPHVIVIPTIEGLGEMALNQAIGQRVVPVELVNRKIHGLYPDEYLRHDMNHALSGYGQNYGDWVEDFHRGFMKKLPHLTKEERVMAELVYFAIGHENPYKAQMEDIYLQGKRHRNKVIRSLERSMAVFNIDRVRSNVTSIFFNAPIPPDFQMKRSEFLEHSISVFRRVAHEVILEENIILPSSALASEHQ